jgi:hypothetical protein
MRPSLAVASIRTDQYAGTGFSTQVEQRLIERALVHHAKTVGCDSRWATAVCAIAFTVAPVSIATSVLTQDNTPHESTRLNLHIASRDVLRLHATLQGSPSCQRIAKEQQYIGMKDIVSATLKNDVRRNQDGSREV